MPIQADVRRSLKVVIPGGLTPGFIGGRTRNRFQVAKRLNRFRVLPAKGAGSAGMTKQGTVPGDDLLGATIAAIRRALVTFPLAAERAVTQLAIEIHSWLNGHFRPGFCSVRRQRTFA
jgi:hypothetical protein